jgi:hypothetical protein
MGEQLALKDLKLLHFRDRETADLQSNVREFLNQLDFNVLQGNVIDNVSLGTTATMIAHKLGRKFLGWQILDIQGDARVWRDTSITDRPEQFLPLKASSSVTVKLWVF